MEGCRRIVLSQRLEFRECSYQNGFQPHVGNTDRKPEGLHGRQTDPVERVFTMLEIIAIVMGVEKRLVPPRVRVCAGQNRRVAVHVVKTLLGIELREEIETGNLKGEKEDHS